MARSSHIASVTVLINIAVGLCSLLWLYNITQNDGLIAPNVGVWLAVLLAFWLLNLFFLRRSRSLLSIVLFNLPLAAVQIIILALLMPKGIESFAITLLIFSSAITSVFAVYFAVNPLYSDHLLPIFEISFVVFIFFLWLKDAVGFSNIVLAPLLITLLINMLSLLLVRVCTPSANGVGQSRIKGATVLLVLFMVLLLLVAVFSLFLAVPIGELALKLVDAVVAAFQQLMEWVSRFFTWLASLLGIEEEKEPEPEKSDCVQTPENYTAPPVNVGFAVIIIGFALLVFLIIKLRKKRFSLNLKRPSIAWLKRFFDNVGDAIGLAWSNFILALQAAYFNVFRRNTLQGLYYYIERRAARLGMYRIKSETPRQFLLRLADRVEERDAVYAAELVKFAGLTDAYFYSRKVEIEAGYLSALRRQSNNSLKQLKKI